MLNETYSESQEVLWELLGRYDAWCTEVVMAGREWWNGFTRKLDSEVCEKAILTIFEDYIKLTGYPPQLPYLPRLYPVEDETITVENGGSICQ
jgi:hypothetical protein